MTEIDRHIWYALGGIRHTLHGDARGLAAEYARAHNRADVYGDPRDLMTLTDVMRMRDRRRARRRLARWGITMAEWLRAEADALADRDGAS